jgi:hypothetical protein
LQLALECSARSVFPEGRPSIPIPDGEWQPPVADPALLAEAERAIGRLEDYLAPIDGLKLSLRIDALLQTYFMAERDQPADELVLQLWLDALARYPEWTVAEAIAEWVANSRERPTIADLTSLCRQFTATADVELHNLRRLVNPWEQEQARMRQAEADAARQRAAERDAFNAANPDWSLGLPATGQRERPMGPAPFDRERRRRVIEDLKKFRLPDADDPRVVEAMRQMEEEARRRGSHDN